MLTKHILPLLCLCCAPLAVAAVPSLSKQEAQAAIAQSIQARQKQSLQDFGEEWDKGELSSGDYRMKFYHKRFGKKPADGSALYIAMHGGGGAPAAVNDGQWENHKKLYQAKEGIYFVPRAPTDTWNMWHQAYMDSFIEKIIELAVIKEGVNPNKVYIMGYSAGGDGTFQLAPRLADLWAAAAMSAGHPGDAQILNLRNVPFGLYMGGQDAAFNRNKLAAQWGEQLDELAKSDKGAFVHDVHIYPQYGHWMNLEDARSMKWMPQFTRNPIPTKVNWVQDDVKREHFYWLQAIEGLDAGAEKAKIVASYKGNTITIEEANVKSFIIGLNDKMLQLDQEVTVKREGKTLFKGKVPRYTQHIESDVARMRDADLIFPAKLIIEGDKCRVYTP